MFFTHRIRIQRTRMARVAFSDDIRRKRADRRNGDVVVFLGYDRSQQVGDGLWIASTSGLNADMVVGEKERRFVRDFMGRITVTN